MATKSVRKGKARLPNAHDFRSASFGPALTTEQSVKAMADFESYAPLSRQVMEMASMPKADLVKKGGENAESAIGMLQNFSEIGEYIDRLEEHVSLMKTMRTRMLIVLSTLDFGRPQSVGVRA